MYLASQANVRVMNNSKYTAKVHYLSMSRHEASWHQCAAKISDQTLHAQHSCYMYNSDHKHTLASNGGVCMADAGTILSCEDKGQPASVHALQISTTHKFACLLSTVCNVYAVGRRQLWYAHVVRKASHTAVICVACSAYQQINAAAAPDNHATACPGCMLCMCFQAGARA